MDQKWLPLDASSQTGSRNVEEIYMGISNLTPTSYLTLIRFGNVSAFIKVVLR